MICESCWPIAVRCGWLGLIFASRMGEEQDTATHPAAITTPRTRPVSWAEVVASPPVCEEKDARGEFDPVPIDSNREAVSPNRPDIHHTVIDVEGSPSLENQPHGSSMPAHESPISQVPNIAPPPPAAASFSPHQAPPLYSLSLTPSPPPSPLHPTPKESPDRPAPCFDLLAYAFQFLNTVLILLGIVLFIFGKKLDGMSEILGIDAVFRDLPSGNLTWRTMY